jgi:CheY-like chemotaxis protein
MNPTYDSTVRQSDPGETPGKDLPPAVLEMHSPRRRKRSWMRRIAVACFSLVFMLGVALAGLFALLSNGPVEVGFLSERIAIALEERLGSGIDVSVGKSVLEKNDRGLELHIRDVVLKDPANREILRSPDALVAFDPLQLATLRLSPRALSFKGVTLTAIITAQNEIILSATPRPAAAEQLPVESNVRAEEIGAFLMAMSRAGPGQGLERLELAEGTLKVEDRRNGKQLAFDNITIDIRTPRVGRLEATGSLRKDTDTVPVFIVADSSAEEHTIRVQIDNIGNSLIQAVAGSRTPVLKLTSKGTTDVTARIGANGALLSLHAVVKAGKGGITVPVISPEPYLIDQFSAEYTWQASTGAPGQLVVSYAGDGTSWSATGPLSSLPEAGAPWRWQATGSNWRLKPLSVAEAPVVAGSAEIVVVVDTDKRILTLEKLTVAGPGTAIALSGKLRAESDGAALDLSVQATRMPIRNTLRWWPDFIAPQARNFLVQSVREGDLTRLNIQLAMPPAVLAKLLTQEYLPAEAFQLDGAVENGVLVLSEGLPPVAGLTGSGRINSVGGQGIFLRGHVDAKTGRRLQLSEGTFALNWPDAAIPDATFRFRSTGQLDAVAEFLRSPDLKGLFNFDINPQDVKGQFDANVLIALPLVETLKLAQIRTEVSGKMTGVTVEKAIGQDRLENATLVISTDKTGVEIKGEGRWQGIPVSLTLENDAADRSFGAVMSLTLDDAALRRRGVNLGTRLTGPLPVKIKTLQETGAKWTAAIEVDLARATIDGLLPGFQKPAGRAGKLSFKASERTGGGFIIENLALDSGASSFRGQAEVLTDGTPVSARFTLFRLSPGDNVRLDFDRQGNGAKVAIRGNNLDARPFLRTMNQAPPTRAEPDKGDLDLDIRATLLSGNGSEVLTGAEIRMLGRNGLPRQISVTGKLNGKTVSVTGKGNGDAPPPVTIESDDAGAFFRYLDIYPRMQGGSLSGQIVPAGRRMSGYFIAKDFSLRNEPAIRRLVTESVPDQARQIAGDTRFTKMRIDFSRDGAETTVKEAVIFGPQIGLTFNGIVDLVRDRISLSGTFIPAYGLNNAFAQIPVVGAILGGGRNEGLLAVTFGVSGRASDPSVTVNPLSAVTPGIFRKIFEFRNDTTGSTPPQQ